MSKEKDNETLPPEEETAATDAPEGAQDAAEVWRDKYLRTLAELDNYRKRMEREREQGRAYALEGILRELLPVLDDLELAAAAAGDSEAIREGIEVALRRACNVLEGKGLELIESVGQPFDPRFHEATGVVPAGDDQPAGTIVSEVRKGYRLRERVLRPSRVQIAAELKSAEDD